MLEQLGISHDAKTVRRLKNGHPPAANLFSNTVQVKPLSAYGAFFLGIIFFAFATRILARKTSDAN